MCSVALVAYPFPQHCNMVFPASISTHNPEPQTPNTCTPASCTSHRRTTHVNCTVQGCNEDELLQLIHEGGLTTRLKGCINKKNPCRGQEGPAAAIDALTALWTKKAAEVSRGLYKKHIEGGYSTVCCVGRDFACGAALCSVPCRGWSARQQLACLSHQEQRVCLVGQLHMQPATKQQGNC